MPGPSPKPTKLKILHGNPGKRPLNDREPIPAAGTPECPDWLDAEAKAEWARIVPELEFMGLLTRIDRCALAAYCQTYSRWATAEQQVAKFGTIVKSPEKQFPMKSPYLTIADQAMDAMRRFLVEFGMTPASRTRIRVPQDGEGADELDAFLDSA